LCYMEKGCTKTALPIKMVYNQHNTCLHMVNKM
jgi:hypothetical protein